MRVWTGATEIGGGVQEFLQNAFADARAAEQNEVLNPAATLELDFCSGQHRARPCKQAHYGGYQDLNEPYWG